MKLGHRFVYLLSTSLVVLSLDQWSKAWAIANLKSSAPIYYWGGIVQLRYAENSGAWGSLGAEWSPLLRQAFLLFVPCLVLIFFVYHILTAKEINRLRAVAYSCVLSGGMGNLVDRLRFDYVVDLFYMGYGVLRTNIFNVADMSIMFGFAIILVVGVIDWKKSRQKDSKESAG